MKSINCVCYITHRYYLSALAYTLLSHDPRDIHFSLRTGRGSGNEMELEILFWNDA